jgi:hypothetical protein
MLGSVFRFWRPATQSNPIPTTLSNVWRRFKFRAADDMRAIRSREVLEKATENRLAEEVLFDPDDASLVLLLLLPLTTL